MNRSMQESGNPHVTTDVALRYENQTLRGHHLSTYARLWDGFTPQRLAEDLTSGARILRGKLSKADAKELLKASYDDSIAGHGLDVLGISKQEEVQSERRTESALTDLKNLPPDATITITAEVDDICRACIHGRHCSLAKATGEDVRYLKAFISTAHNNALDNEIKEGEATVYVSDSEKPIVTPIITTSAKILRSIATSPDFHNNLLAELVKDK